LGSTVVDINAIVLDNEIKPFPESLPEYFVAENGVVRSEFYEIGNRVVFESKGRRFTWTLQSMRYVDANGIEDLIYSANAAPLEIVGNTARYNGQMPDVDNLFTQENDRLKHDIILQTSQREPLPWLSGPIDLSFGGRIEFVNDLRVRVDGLIMVGVFETGGQIEIVDADDSVLFVLPPVVAFDSHIPDRASTGGKYRVNSNADGMLAFDIIIDNAWISSVDRIYPIIIDPTTVVSSAYNVQNGHGTRKIICLDNGWYILAVAKVSAPAVVYLYKSLDNGSTWSQLCHYNAAAAIVDWMLEKIGNTVYILYGVQSTAVFYHSFNPTTVSNVDLSSSAVSVGYYSFYCSMSVSNWVWVILALMNSDSINLVAVRSTNGGSTWDAYMPLTNSDTIYENNLRPYTISISQQNNQFVVVLFIGSDTGGNQNYLGCMRNSGTGTTWSRGAGPVNPSWVHIDTESVHEVVGLKKLFGSNVGRIWAVYKTSNHLKSSYSDDNGANWVAGPSFSIQVQSISISEHINGDIYVFYRTPTYSLYYARILNATLSWSSATALDATPTSGFDTSSAIQTYNSGIGCIYGANSAVKFEKVSFNSAPNAPILSMRSNFDANTSAALAWTFSDPDAGNTQIAYQLIITKVSDGSTVLDTGKVVSTFSSYILAAGTLVEGTSYQWKVRTWDNADAAGPYSGAFSFETFSHIALFFGNEF